MTTPTERTRHLVQAGAFLRELRGNRKLPQQVRDEAHRLLRHYPTISDIEHIASVATGSIFGNPLTTEFDPDWLRGYNNDGHRI